MGSNLKMRTKGDKEWQDRDTYKEEVDDMDIAFEVEQFAEEWGLKEGDVIQVYRRGEFKIDWVESRIRIAAYVPEQLIFETWVLSVLLM